MNVPYPFKSATEMLGYCKETGLSLSGMVMQNELALHSKRDRRLFCQRVANHARLYRSRDEHRRRTAGPLRVPRRASALRRMLVTTDKFSNDPMNVVDWVNMFALAVNEENAAGARGDRANQRRVRDRSGGAGLLRSLYRACDAGYLYPLFSRGRRYRCAVQDERVHFRR